MFTKTDEAERQKHIDRITEHLKSKGWTVDAYGYLSKFKLPGIKLRVIFKKNIVVCQTKHQTKPWRRKEHAKINECAL